jgi:sulfite oxidase
METTIRPQRLVHDEEGLNTAVWPVPDGRIVTPVDSFFTRSHAPVPRIDRETWRLEVDGLVARPASFSFDQLVRSFPRRQVTATLVCAGLRRDEFLGFGPLPGELPWGPEPASTGHWTGIALGDLLRAAGVSQEARYVEFIGLDEVERQGQRFGFGGSIDLAKALSDEVLLATHLNGAPLPPQHGFPLRAVVPGWIGARSVKWLGRISLRRDPTPNYFQSQAYRVQREVDPGNPRDVSRGVALSEVPVNAVILEPLRDQRVTGAQVRVRGWAMGSAGRPVSRVEVSTNGGVEWVPARILPPESAWAWVFWEATLDLAPGDHTLVVRAIDTSGANQPPSVAATWNVKGYANNAWHRVTIRVTPLRNPGELEAGS